MTISAMKEAFSAVMQYYLQSLNRYTDEQFMAQPAAGEWSLGQMYEHLLGANTYFFMANTRRCLDQRKGQEGGEMTDGGQKVFLYNSFPPIKVKIPEAIRGPEPLARNRAAYRTLFEQSLQDGLQLAEKLLADEGTYKTQHPVFGWLNAREWFQASEMHARHHLRQQKDREEWLGIAAS